MRRALTLALIALGGFASPPTAWAQPEVEVTLDAAPIEARVGDTIRLEARVRARGARIQSLELADLRKYPELEIVSRQTMRPMQFSFGLGAGVQMESSFAEIYILRPTVPGNYAFSPAVARVDGKTYTSSPLTLVVQPVVGGASGTTVPAVTPDISVDSELSGGRYDAQAFLRTVVEPKEVYIGQQVDVSVYLYTRLRLSPQSVVPSKPSMDGFWVHDDPIKSLQSETVSVRGAYYRAYLLQRSAAFPQRSGELAIGPPKVTFDVGGGSFFNAAERIERIGVPVVVEVKPLPKPGPANAVLGRYDVRAWLDRDTAKTGDAVTLRIDATGTGNVQDLRIDLPPITGVRALKPTIRDQQHFKGGKLSGTRSWEWILIAETPGLHVVPPIRLHFFDPETEAYGVSATPTLSFASSGAGKPPPERTIRPVDAAPKATAAKFGPIRMYSALTRGEIPVRERPWFAWGLAFPPVVFAFVMLGTSIARRRERRSTTAGAVQRKLIRSARSALRDDDPRSFYDCIVASLTHALDSKLGEPVGGLPHAKLRTRLVTEGFDDDLVERVINELEGADFARFAASGVKKDEMDRCLQRTSAIVERIERSRSKA